MTPRREDTVERICMAALEREPSLRGRFVREACAGDEPLRLEIESLLSREPRAEGFLATAALDVAAEEIARRPSLIGSNIGHYEILSLLGAGGMGEVYRARDSTLKREVAIKVLPAIFTDEPDRRGRLEREARVLASLNHLNIGAIYGLEQADGVPALVLELVEGPTLSDRLARGRLPLAEALAIAGQIADALEAAHGAGVVHRDLKPANIKVTASGLVKVLDFGLAKAIAGVGPADDLLEMPDVTRDGLIFGTVGYMSPEQARGHLVDKRTDIWAFGCVVYEMLTGEPAFAGQTNSDIIAAILGAGVPWHTLPDGTPPGVRRLLRRCLERDLKKRIHDVADARLELEESITTGAAEVIEPAEGADRTWRWVMGTIAVILAAGLLAVQRRPADAPPMVTRFAIGAPENGSFTRGSNGRMLAVSPDGTTVALAARGHDGPALLWLRSLDALEARAIPGTDGAEGLFWSPDSASVGFFAGGTLKAVSVQKKEIRTICDVAGSTTQASWSQAGVIIFAAETRGVGGLRRVAAAGGTATALTTPDASRGETGHLAPSFLPDGEHFLYDATAKDGGTVYIGSLGSKDRIELLHPSTAHGASSVLGTALAYAAPGYVLFVQDGTLLAQPFDAARLAASGEPIPIAERVQNFGAGSAAFSVSTNGVLAYWSGGEFATRRLAWFTRDGRESAIPLPMRPYGRIALSPENSRAVVEQQGPAGSTSVALLDLTRGLSTTLTTDAFSIWPLWSPDGEHVIFSSTRGGMLAPYRQSVGAAEDAQRLFDSRGATVATDMSADGSAIVYATRAPAGSDIGLFPLTGAVPPRPSIHVGASVPDGHLSPDGRWLAYTANELGPPEVFVTSFPDGRGRWPISGPGGTQPRWRRDGKELYYLSSDRKLMAVHVSTEPTFNPSVPVAVLQQQIMEYAVGDEDRFLVEIAGAPATRRRLRSCSTGRER